MNECDIAFAQQFNKQRVKNLVTYILDAIWLGPLLLTLIIQKKPWQHQPRLRGTLSSCDSSLNESAFWTNWLGEWFNDSLIWCVRNHILLHLYFIWIQTLWLLKKYVLYSMNEIQMYYICHMVMWPAASVAWLHCHLKILFLASKQIQKK